MKIIIKITYIMVLLSLLLLACRLFPTNSSTRPIQFDLKFEYISRSGDAKVSTLFPGREENTCRLSKAFYGDPIDAMHVLVLDFSNYKDMEEFWESDEYHQYSVIETAQQETDNSLRYWSDIESMLTTTFTIATNETLPVEGDTVHADVTGVLGLNFIFVVGETNGQIQYIGREHVHPEEAENIEEVYVRLEAWEYYQSEDTTSNDPGVYVDHL